MVLVLVAVAAALRRPGRRGRALLLGAAISSIFASFVGALRSTLGACAGGGRIRALRLLRCPRAAFSAATVTLALSLHAPFDELRRRIIPWAEYSTIDELLDACQEWFVKTGREITLEYILLGGVNDRIEHAEELARLARTMRANVNLIRYNEVEGVPFARPGTEDVRRFQEILRARRVNAHIRASRGRDIAAACGQLRHEHAAAADGDARS